MSQRKKNLLENMLKDLLESVKKESFYINNLLQKTWMNQIKKKDTPFHVAKLSMLSIGEK